MIALVAGCGSGLTDPSAHGSADRPAPQGPSALPPTFYVDPANPAAEQAARWESEGRVEDAAQLRKIGERPTAKWLTGEQVLVRDEVDAYVGRAAVAGQMPVLVAHNIPERDCGRHGAGGAATGDEYRSWIRELAAGIKGRPVTVIVEPNAVADAVDGCVTNVDERYALLRDAVNVLDSTGSARIYLDAGHPRWIKDVDSLAEGLNRAGIGQADGFALNVANFFSTADNVRYGHRISDALGGKVPFVIDTSRNGNGPYPRATVGGAPSWCNPPGRALGAEPTDDPGLERVDALLWIKYPGESDGACRPGEPEAGTWWPEYALDLARRAAGDRG
jgi:endoglucanase